MLGFYEALRKIFEKVSRVLIATSTKILFHQYAFGFMLNGTQIAGFLGGRFPTKLASPE